MSRRRGVETQHSIRETADEARQGVTGHKVRYVLAASCSLAVVLMIAVLVLVGR
jgi:hypothetical protein